MAFVAFTRTIVSMPNSPSGVGLSFNDGLELLSQSEDEDDATSFSGYSSDSPDDSDLDDFLSYYFTERDGRLFHSHGISLYPLPVDTMEQQVCKAVAFRLQHCQNRTLTACQWQRQIVLHILVRLVVGRNCVGPVEQVLAPSRRRKLVLDMATGTGHW